MTAASTHMAAAQWLASAHPNPQRAYWEWEEQGVAVIPVGPVWDAVKLPSTGTNPSLVRDVLAECGVDGPIIHNPSTGANSVLVPPGTSPWHLPGTVLLHASDDYEQLLGVPAIERQTPPGLHWVIPPDGTGHLADPDALHRTLVLFAEAAEETSQDPT